MIDPDIPRTEGCMSCEDGCPGCQSDEQIWDRLCIAERFVVLVDTTEGVLALTGRVDHLVACLSEHGVTHEMRGKGVLVEYLNIDAVTALLQRSFWRPSVVTGATR